MSVKSGRFLVSLDLDLTLTNGVTACQYLGSQIGYRNDIDALVARHAEGAISNRTFVERFVPYIAAFRESELSAILRGLPLIPGAEVTILQLKRMGAIVAINTITWSLAAKVAAATLGIDYHNGWTVAFDKSGFPNVNRLMLCDSQDKALFICRLCHELAIPLNRTIHVGDSMSDQPGFLAASCSILRSEVPVPGLNTSYRLRLVDLRELLPTVVSWLSCGNC